MYVVLNVHTNKKILIVLFFIFLQHYKNCNNFNLVMVFHCTFMFVQLNLFIEKVPKQEIKFLLYVC